MRFSEYNDKSLSWILLHEPGDPPCNAKIPASDAAHVVAGMAIDCIYRSPKSTGGVEYFLIGLPVATPFLVITNAVQKFLFRHLSRHPGIQHLLVPGKDRLDRQGNISFACDDFLQQRSDKVLTGGERM